LISFPFNTLTPKEITMNKPTKDELKAWEETLRKQGLGMGRARNTDKLNYGFADGNSLIRTWDDVKVYTRQKRKTTECTCVVCGSPFPARFGANICSRKCERRNQHVIRKQRFKRIKGL
jgi:predicted nucleic acid-binding Zn ribbon protein